MRTLTRLVISTGRERRDDVKMEMEMTMPCLGDGLFREMHVQRSVRDKETRA